MRRLYTSWVLSTLLLGASTAQATVNWNWSFTQSTLNLAESASIDVTVTNLASSDESIVRVYVDFSSFGDFGLLKDSVSGHYVVPTLWENLQTPLAPGASVTLEALRFSFAGGPPSTSFSQTITPSLLFWSSNCDQLECGMTKPGDNSLTLFYAPVPEAASWSLWAIGLGCLAAFGRRRRAGPVDNMVR